MERSQHIKIDGVWGRMTQIGPNDQGGTTLIWRAVGGRSYRYRTGVIPFANPNHTYVWHTANESILSYNGWHGISEHAVPLELRALVALLL